MAKLNSTIVQGSLRVTDEINASAIKVNGTNVLTSHQSVSSSNNTASFGSAVVVGTVGGTDLKFTMPANPNSNTWRKVQLNGTDKLGTGTGTNPLNIKAGSNMTITESGGTFTFAATDTTYSNASQSAAGLMSATDKTRVDNMWSALNGTDSTKIDTIAEVYAFLEDYAQTTDLAAQLGTKVTANSAITGAQKCKITYDSKGLVTDGVDLAASDIPSLDTSKITTGTFDIGRIPTGTTAATVALGNHTHSYAGSSSAGGAATEAIKLVANASRIASADIAHYYTGNKAHMQLDIVSSTMTTNKPAADGYMLTFLWDNSGQYNTQIYIPNGNTTTDKPQMRFKNNGTWTSWAVPSFPASDVPAWAKAATKPSYTLDEVSDGTTRKLDNFVPFSGAIHDVDLGSAIKLSAGYIDIYPTSNSTANNAYSQYIAFRESNTEGDVTGIRLSADGPDLIIKNVDSSGNLVTRETIATHEYISALGYTSNNGTVTKVSTGIGLTGGDVTTTGTIKAALVNETKSAIASTYTAAASGDKFYAVQADKNGKLGVRVPWTDNNTTYSNGTGLTLTGTTFSVSTANASTILNQLTTGSSDPQDDDYFISQYAGGGSTTTTYHRRPVSKLYNYMKGKMDSVYQAKGSYLSSVSINGTSGSSFTLNGSNLNVSSSDQTKISAAISALQTTAAGLSSSYAIDVTETDSNNANCYNKVFNDDVTGNIIETLNDYFVANITIGGSIPSGTHGASYANNSATLAYIKTAGGTNVLLSNLKVGDTIFLRQVNLPDVWVTEVSGVGTSTLTIGFSVLEPFKLVWGAIYDVPESFTPSSHSHGNITNSGTITSTAVTSATGVLVYDSNNKIQRATAANARAIIGAGTGNGTVTSVRVQAGTGLSSSTSTAQSSSLDTTISIASGYKLPTTTEWNGKQNSLTTQTAYSAKGSATKVPQITTNTLGQVTGITEVTITNTKTYKHDIILTNSASASSNASYKICFTLYSNQSTALTITGAMQLLFNKPPAAASANKLAAWARTSTPVYVVVTEWSKAYFYPRTILTDNLTYSGNNLTKFTLRPMEGAMDFDGYNMRIYLFTSDLEFTVSNLTISDTVVEC